jgi:EAL domain-containing protein (putative c-di-GMP-specific phosphodiesterase class I)/NO-binding membrane sensor protein with MHYT domain
MVYHNYSFILLGLTTGIFVALLTLRLVTLMSVATSKEKNVLFTLSTLMLGSSLWVLQVTHDFAFPLILKTGFSLKTTLISWFFAVFSAFILLFFTSNSTFSKRTLLFSSLLITLSSMAIVYFNILAMEIRPPVDFSTNWLMLSSLTIFSTVALALNYLFKVKYQAHLFPLRKKMTIAFVIATLLMVVQIMLDQSVRIPPNAISLYPIDFDSLMVGFKIGLGFISLFIMPFIIAIFYDKFKFNTFLWRQITHPYQHHALYGHAFNQTTAEESLIDTTVLEKDLTEIFSYDALHLYFQLKIDSQTRLTVGAEAFTRWLHPTKGLLMPADFMAIAASLDMRDDIDAWAIEESCRMLHRLKNEGIDLPISVNLSQDQLNQATLIPYITDLLKRFNLAKENIIFEIPESIAFTDTAHLNAQLKQFQEAGFNIAIDDFGTQSSILSKLQNLPVTELKLGPALTSDIEKNEKTRGVVQAVIDIAHVLGLKVVAESVETEGQRKHLVELGCDQMQGFLISPPLPEHRFLALIKNLQIKS